jgi:hypothetical protein
VRVSGDDHGARPRGLREGEFGHAYVERNRAAESEQAGMWRDLRERFPLPAAGDGAFDDLTYRLFELPDAGSGG